MWIDRESQIDLLAYEPFAELVNNIVCNERMNPLTIGLFGSWGVGKSTLLKLIENKIIDADPAQEKIVCVSLNSWMFEGYDDAKSAIMESLLRKLEENKTVFKKFEKDIKSLIKRIDFFRVGALAIKHGAPIALSLLNPAAAAFSAFTYFTSDKIGKMVDDTKGVVKNKGKDEHESMVQNIRLFRNEFEKLLSNSGIDNLVIMIDDLDRCTPERIIETLEAIKLFLSVPRTTFIIAIDDKVVKYSVKKKYPKIDDETIEISDNYIEKIIQLPIYIPELTESDLKNYLLLLICELYMEKDELNTLLSALIEENLFLDGIKIDISRIEKSIGELTATKFKNKDMEGFTQTFNIISLTSDVMACTLKGNPRQAKRFLNTFLIRKSLSEIYYKKAEKLDYSILAKLLALEYINDELFRELYKWSLKNKSKSEIVELKTLVEAVNSNEEIPEDFRKWNDDRIIRWLKSEPQKIYEKDLAQYFYLSRESLNINYNFIDNFTKEEREVFNEIVHAKKPVMLEKTIKEIKSRRGVKHNKVIDAIIEQFKNNIDLIRAIQHVYTHHGEYRFEIKQIVKNYNAANVNPIVATVLNSMYRIDPDDFADVVSSLEKNGVSKEAMEIIKKQSAVIPVTHGQKTKGEN